MSSATHTVRILLLTVLAFTGPGVRALTFTPDRGTTITISTSQVKGCKVCTGSSPRKRCVPSLQLKDNSPVSVEFECPRPQDVFSVEIVRSIECTTKSCSGNIIQADYGSLPLLAFNRTFTWNLTATSPKAFKIDFGSSGVRQVIPSERCPDKHSYTLHALQTTGDVAVGTYCMKGLIQSAQILNKGSFSLEVPGGQKLQSGQFVVSVGEEIKSLAKVSLTLPKGTSSSELLSPNYPDSFPDDDVMEWCFQVPDKYKTTVQFLNFTEPICMKKEAAVEYHSKGRGALVLCLSDPQPHQNQGDFSLTLRNCEMDRKRSGSSGLSLNFRVAASSKSSPVPCKVDVGRLDGLHLHIERVRPTSECQMKVNNVKKDKITVTTKSDLTFQDCLPEDVKITATRVIGCSQLRDCPKTPQQMFLPSLPSCLPAALSAVTWTLRPPQDGTVELTSPSGALKQSLPMQKCNESLIIEVVQDDGTVIGNFCQNGSIEKIQIHKNISITLSVMGSRARKAPFLLEAKVTEEISERYIFSVSPKKDIPVYIATPGWPAGMKPYSTVSWFVKVPSKMDAVLMFPNPKQPKCENRHTNIRVQRVGSEEEDYSRREDEKTDGKVTVAGNFFLNMSNCMPQNGEFSIVTRISLQKSKNLLLTIILSVVAVLVVIFIIVLAVVCVVIRKKKKKLENQVSIYNPGGTTFLPGQNGFPPTTEDDHEYASIEDTLVYTHLLRKGREIGIYGDFDKSRPFAGHSDSQKPLVSKDSTSGEPPIGVYQPFTAPPLPNRPPSHGNPLVDNEIYHGGEGSEEGSPNLGPRMEPEGGN